MEVSYRRIAKLLARGMPIEGQEYIDIIEGYINSIEAMPNEHKQTLRASYIFSCLAPRDDRQDLFQELVAYTLTQLAKYDGRIKDVEAFSYTVARHKWGDWWKQKKRRRQILNGGFISLNKLTTDNDGEQIELQDLIADDLGLESELESKLDSQALLSSLPNKIKAIVVKRLNRQTPTNHQYQMLARYREENECAIRAQLRA